MPGKDRDGREVPIAAFHVPRSPTQHLCHAARSRTLLSLGHSQEPTSPYPLSKDLPLPGVLPSAHAATKPQQRRAPLDLHCGHQPCDSATGMTAVSALPPGERLHHVPVPRTLQSRCIGRCRTGGHGQSGRQKPCSWQSSHPCTQKQVLTSTEKCTSLI